MVPFLKGEAEKGKGANYEVSFEDVSSWILRKNVCGLRQLCCALENNKEANQVCQKELVWSSSILTEN